MNWSSLISNSLLTVVVINAINFFLINCFVNQSLIPLDEYIKHYEPLTYDTEVVLSRAKRSLLSQFSSKSQPIIVEFKSHGRNFRIRLRRDYSSVFHKDLVIESSDGKPIKVNLDHIVSGELVSQPRSKVFGSISDGIFEGQIHTQNNETFYVERAVKYFNNSNDVNNNKTSLPFHSVIYSATDVTDPYLHKRSIIDSEWGTNQNVNEWMDRTSNSVVHQKESSSHSLSRNKLSDSSHNYWTMNFEAQRRIESTMKASHKTNHNIPYVPQKRVCSLYIQTDTYLWDEIKKKESSDTKAREEVVSLVAQHIKAVNHIYESTVFKDIYGLKFNVKRLRINDLSACVSQLKRDSNKFCQHIEDIDQFLDFHSEFNHNDFCLSYIFTYRDFSNGTLGGAYIGGVCDKSLYIYIGGRQVKIKRSQNTGFITFLNYNRTVPPKYSELTLAHEIGHNFGSPHDPSECIPGGSQGNFLMYPFVNSDEKPNNNKFSNCSLNNISLVLNYLYNYNEGKYNCFEEDNEPFCGNKIVENGEECDCGYDSKQCNEKCCYPRKVEPFIQFEPKAKACHRRQSFKCSPSEGLCCSDMCEIEARAKQCRPESECNLEAFCNGYNASCPRSQPKPNKTECNGGKKVCWRGKCVYNHEKQDDNHRNLDTGFVIILILCVSAVIYSLLSALNKKMKSQNSRLISQPSITTSRI